MGYLGRSCFINMFLLEAGRTWMCFIIFGQGFDASQPYVSYVNLGSLRRILERHRSWDSRSSLTGYPLVKTNIWLWNLWKLTVFKG